MFMRQFYKWMAKASLLLSLLLISAPRGLHAQATYLANESFKASLPSGWSVQPVSTTALPTWESSTQVATSGHYSMRGHTPYNTGDSVELVSPFYDCTNYKYVVLKFSHICKILQSDICQVMYQEQGLGGYYRWKELPVDAYKGKSLTYREKKLFNHTSYTEWMPTDTYALAQNGWWKEESFDLSNYASYTKIRFKFVIRKGNFFGSYAADGWFVDDFQLMASQVAIAPPVVDITSSYAEVLYYTGPFTINAKVATRTEAPIVRPWLCWTATLNNVTTTDSVRMTDRDGGDSLWTAEIPQHEYESVINYYIIGRDSAGNSSRDAGGFSLKYKGGVSDSNSVAMDDYISPLESTVAGTQPVLVSIRNIGLARLRSVNIGWSVNGVIQTPKAWTGNLPCDFTETVNIGTYTQRLDRYDTLKAWVYMPNNVTDPLWKDDTMEWIVYGCDSSMHGVYTVGAGKDFATLEEALFILSTCGAGGDVEFQLASGEYNRSLDFYNFGTQMGKYRLTISSIAGHADSVVFLPAKGVVVTLSNANHLRFENLTFSAANAASYVVNFTSRCDDVEFRHCHLRGYISSSTGAEHSVIYSAKTSVNDVRFIGNHIEYGSYGIYMNGMSATDPNTHILFDSNLIERSYYYPLYVYYTEMDFLHNTLVEGENVYTYFYGATFYYSHNTRVDANRIHGFGAAQYKYGFRFYYCDSTMLVCNNEVVLKNATGASYAYQDYYPYGLQVINNSAYLTGSSNSTFYGYYLYNTSNTYWGVIRNNNIVIDSVYPGTAYPLYVGYSQYVNRFDIDYNNWASKNNMANVGSVISSPAAFTAAVPSALHETNIYPAFTDTSAVIRNLQMASYNQLKCPAYPGVTSDVDGAMRLVVTGRGCYTSSADSANAALMALLGWPESGQGGDTLTPSVVLQNGGILPLRSVTIGWEVNGIRQPDVKWTGNLQIGETDTVILGRFVALGGYNNIVAYVVSLGNNMIDSESADDTISASHFSCAAALTGTFTIGDTGYFKSLDEALRILGFCGLGGPVTLAYLPGTYYQNSTIGWINGMSAANTLTITSYLHDSSSVLLVREDDCMSNLAAIMINGASYVEICDLGLTGQNPNYHSYAYSRGIMVTGNSSHINIHNCHLWVPKSFSQAVTGTAHGAVYLYGNGVKDVRLHHNLMEGGSLGVYVYGSDATARIARIEIDNNLIDSVDYSAVYMYYADSVFVHHNMVKQRRGNFTLANMYAIYAYYSNANVEGNIFDVASLYMGFYTSYFGDVTNGYRRIVNNEYRATCSTSGGYGLYLANASTALVYHNTFRLKDIAPSQYGVYFASSNVYDIEIKNNIFDMANPSINSYPVYIPNTSYLANNVDINNNCYWNAYASNPNVGYAGRAITSMSEWRNTVSSDVASRFVSPNYVNTEEDLHLMDTVGVTFPVIASVPTDIRGVLRDTAVAVAGAWQVEFHALDLALKEIISPASSEATMSQVPVKVVISNVGTSNITSAKVAFQVNTSTPVTYSWTGLLKPYEEDTVTIGSLYPVSGINEFKAWVASPNGGADADWRNDTMRMTMFGCDSVMKGVYVVGGANARFANIEDAIAALSACGVGGPVELRIATGVYSGFSVVGDIPGCSETNTVKFTSLANRRDSVIFYDMSSVKVSRSSHLIFEELAFNGQVIGVELEGTVKNVLFHNCYIASPIASHPSYRAVSYAGVSNSGERLDDVRFINNVINGGYYGMYLYYVRSNANELDSGVGVTIDSNILRNSYYNAVYAYYYGLYKSFSHNTITNYSGASTYYGLYSYYCRWENIDGNRIYLNNASTAYGMYLYYQNYNSKTDTMMVTNNEVVITNGGSNKYGVYLYYPYGPITLAHNSVFTNSTITSYGMYLYNTQTAYAPRIYNNMLVNGNNSGYPLYIATATYITPAYHLMDYNNYVSGGSYLAYLGSAKNTLAAIKSANVLNNQHSVSVKPVWNNNTNLRLNNPKSFWAPAIYGVDSDIDGAARFEQTTIGCYSTAPDSNDASLIAIDGLTRLTAGNSGPISVVIQNKGLKDMDSAVITMMVDNVMQPAVQYKPARPLAYGQSDTVLMGYFSLLEGTHTIVAWVDMTGDGNKSNDTTSVSGKVCSKVVSGTYVIGSSPNADYTFANLSALFNEMKGSNGSCGVAGDVTLAFESGVYTSTATSAITLADIATAMGDYHLTLTSLAGHRDSATISCSGTQVVMIGSTNKNITIENLTLVNTSTTSSRYIIYLTNGCGDITIQHNNTYFDTTKSYTTYHVYNPSGGVVSNIRIVGNRMMGAYYGIYLYGSSSSAMNTNVVVDSNEMIGQLVYGTYCYYTQFKSFSHNNIRVRTKNGTNLYYGINMYYCIADDIIGNRIDATRGGTSIAYQTYPMYLYYLNYYNVTYPAMVANNTIKCYLSTSNTSAYYAVYTQNNRMNFYHNTVYMTGGMGAAFRGNSSSPYVSELKGNVFVVSNAQQAFINDYTTNMSGFVLDYNNYYNNGGSVLAKVQGFDCKNLADLRTYGGMDAHSVSTMPTFPNLAHDLSIKSKGDLVMPRLKDVQVDINNDARGEVTLMGAYEDELTIRLDAMLSDFADVKMTTASSPVSVILGNKGLDTLRTAVINWEFNGVAQTPVNWTGKLALGESEKVSLGNITPLIDKINRLKAWVSQPNGGTDSDHFNDTISYEEYACSSVLAAGTYTVGGSNPDFADLDELTAALYTCGISGPVVIRFRQGTYGTLNLLGEIPGASASRTVTFLPERGTVVLDGGSKAAGAVLYGVSHVRFHNLTFGNTTNGLMGIRMAAGCSDVIIRECNIYANKTATSSTYSAFRYDGTSGSTTYPVDVRIVANNITGGYHNMYLYYMCGNTSYMTSASMYIDSNVMTEAYYYGMYNYYNSSIRSLCHNTIRSREGTSMYYGVYSYYYSNYDKVMCNRIYVNNKSTGYGMYMSYYQNNPSYSNGRALIANNEIRLFGTNTKYGMYLQNSYSRMDIHYNSIYSQTDNSTSYGVYWYAGTNTTYQTNFTRNMVISSGTTSYPIYLYGSNTTTNYYTLAYGLREYNNLYSETSANVGYVRLGSVTKTSIPDFQAVTTQDSNSISAKPSFIRVANSLELNDYTAFACPSIPEVPTDLNGNPRSNSSAMGCYGAEMWDGVNLQAVAFLKPVAIADVVCYTDSTPVEIVIRNMGRKTASFDTSALRIDLDVRGAISFHFDTTITSGSLRPTQVDTLYLTTIPTIANGTYNLQLQLTDTSDVLAFDDRLMLSYKANRVELPYDVDFSTTPKEFVNVIRSGNVSWSVEPATSVTPASVFGTGSLVFAGAGQVGAASEAVFNAVNIQGCLNPKLSFWYAHSSDNTKRDLMHVLVTTNAGASYTEVGRVMVADTFTGWKQYDIDLSRFVNEPCLSIVFQAISYGGSDQALDRVRIMADQDVSIRMLPIDYSAFSACENDQVPLKAVISNLTMQTTPLTKDTIVAEVTGATTQQLSYVFTKVMGGYETDTITFGNIDMRANGNYYIAMRMQSQDDNTANDTVCDSTYYVHQDVSLNRLIGTDDQRLDTPGDQIRLSAVVQNLSNMTVNSFRIGLKLNDEIVVVDTVRQALGQGDSMTHAFTKPYVVPEASKDQPFYFLEVTVDMDCDADTSNNMLNAIGMVDVPDTIDIQVLAVTTTSPATGKMKLSPTVRIANIGNADASNIVIHVDVQDASKTVVESITENLSVLGTNETKDYTFAMTYKVPDYTGQYSLKAYVTAYNGDSIQHNDTISATFDCFRDSTGIRYAADANWSLGQNIPNPASSVTRIPYSIPQEDVMVFSVMSANGQLLHREQLNGETGERYIELNVSDYASGIYYYSVEYQGQRVVRKMNVVR